MIWESILLIKEQAAIRNEWPETISLWVRGDYGISWNEEDKSADAIIRCNTETKSCLDEGFLVIDLPSSSTLTHEETTLLQLYVPYTMLCVESNRNQRCMAVSHFAQTLDGRIATSTGDSKWIGNEENLVHAHRMRALSDAILIGSRTLHIDNPRLNVRKVAGKSPVKVIIGGDKLAIDDYKAIDNSTIMFCQNHQHVDIANKVALTKVTAFDTQDILKALFERGLHSVYIEGGACTTSHFLQQRTLDQVQLHISPKILGSGVSSFAFDGIFNMSDAIDFKQGRFVPIGSDVMFIGNL